MHLEVISLPCYQARVTGRKPDRSAKLNCLTSVGWNDDIRSVLFTIVVEHAESILNGLTIYSTDCWEDTHIIPPILQSKHYFWMYTIVVFFRHFFRTLCLSALRKWSLQFWVGYPTMLGCVSIRLRTSRDWEIFDLKCRFSCYFGVSIGLCCCRVFGKNSYTKSGWGNIVIDSHRRIKRLEWFRKTFQFKPFNKDWIYNMLIN